VSAVTRHRVSIGALATTIVVVLVAGACRGDGRDLRDPSAPVPPTTTTTTTLPPDVLAPTVTP
jgi:hypothetical protein